MAEPLRQQAIPTARELAGLNSGRIENSYNTGAVSGTGTAFVQRIISEDYIYYPELEVFYESENEVVERASERSARVTRLNLVLDDLSATEITLGNRAKK
jgi:hypothetical protein